MTIRSIFVAIGLLAMPGLASAARPQMFTSAESPEATARCIAAHLSRNAQIHAAGDGQMAVATYAPRGRVSRWIIAPAGEGSSVERSGNANGLGRELRQNCFR